jgi:DNA-directed RNA polymerase subunit alpha
MARQLDLTVFEPGDTVGTMSQDGHVALWTVSIDGSLVRADSRLFGNVTGFTLETRIEELDLQVRTFNLLKREGINTVGDLLTFTHENDDEAMLAIRNMGVKNVAEIREWAARLRSERP